MLHSTIKISAVSYLNTLPFLFGIKKSGFIHDFDFQLDYPALTAKKIIDKEVDIALVPVAAIPNISNARIISDFCIGAFKQVKSVLLLSDVPMENIKTVLLDYQSQTSVNLVRILASKFWLIYPEWVNTQVEFENSITGSTAGVVIGDRTFPIFEKHKFVYDLSLEWYKFTGLPIVFAAWVTNKNLPEKFIVNFNKALEYGTQHLDDVANEYKNQNPLSEINLLDYLKNNLDFRFDDNKKQSLKLFYSYLVEMNLLEKSKLDEICF